MNCSQTFHDYALRSIGSLRALIETKLQPPPA